MTRSISDSRAAEGAIKAALVRPTFDEFERLATTYNRVPIVATLIADDLTPVSAFARLEADAARAFLFESVVGGEKVARYSFVGADPERTLEARGTGLRICSHRGAPPRDCKSADPLLELKAELDRIHSAQIPGLPHFLGGAVGYAAYDLVRYYERLPNAPKDDRDLPDVRFDLYESLVIFDHAFKLLYVVTHAAVAPGDGTNELKQAFDKAVIRLQAVGAKLGCPVGLPPLCVSLPAPRLEQFTSNLTRPQFENAVRKCQEYIRAGDIFQVVLAQRLEIDSHAAPLDIYRALRVVNPSPFMFFLKSPDVTLIGASPEILCRVEGTTVTNRPLAGTRRRGADAAEDARLRDELLADPKERAEHVMLVDLGRNDIGRVARPGSVRLSELMAIELYSHVMHISSTVTGELADGLTCFDALRATLPVGTVSGAPKVRAMEIIDECEPTRRGPYGGAVGYIDYSGNMDTCIALRTLVIQPRPAGRQRIWAQVGAGVVADSSPAAEYDETLNKAGGLLAAIRLAEERLHAAGATP